MSIEVENILKSNLIDLSVTSYGSATSRYKKYEISIQNRQLNILKKFYLVKREDLFFESFSVGKVLFECFNSITLALVGISKYVDLDGNINKDLNPSEEYIRPIVKQAVFMQRDLEEVLDNCFPEILECAASSDDLITRKYAASSTKCPKEAVVKLLLDEEEFVRDAALSHPHAKDLKAFI